MSELDYVYRFDDIMQKQSLLQFANLRKNEQHDVYVKVNDSQLLLKRHHQMPAEIADLVDLAVTVYIADRLSIQENGISRNIHIILPVRHPEILNSSPVVEHLQEILYWYTSDHWSFEFTLRNRYGRPAELQMCMPLIDSSNNPVEVALWSGGLDSLAGLQNRLLANPSMHYLLFGTGANNFVHYTQQRVAEAIGNKFPGCTTLIQLLVQLDETKNLPKSSSQRSRGFFFMLLGAICAYMEGQDTLHVYENGIGAINLPFRESEIGLDHSRAVHPLSLLYMSSLVSQLFGKSFSFKNPFLFQTKAQMCKVFTSLNTTDLVFYTFTCDRPRREQPMQCGCCSSCLMRRQALAVLGIKDQTPYVVTSAYSQGRICQPSDGDHLRAMLDQVKSLRSLLNSATPWFSMSKKYTTLSEIVDRTAKQEGLDLEKMKERLLQLYRRYVQEWDNEIQYILSSGLLEEGDVYKTA